jgi:hypothetical protein
MPNFARSGELDLDEMLEDYLKQSKVVTMRNIRTQEPMGSAVSNSKFAGKDADMVSLLVAPL